jgi:hypothetical protein
MSEGVWSKGGTVLTGEHRRAVALTWPSDTLSTTNPTFVARGFNGALRYDVAAKHLSHGTAQSGTVCVAD